jgi:sortase A
VPEQPPRPGADGWPSPQRGPGPQRGPAPQGSRGSLPPGGRGAAPQGGRGVAQPGGRGAGPGGRPPGPGRPAGQGRPPGYRRPGPPPEPHTEIIPRDADGYGYADGYDRFGDEPDDGYAYDDEYDADYDGEYDGDYADDDDFDQPPSSGKGGKGGRRALHTLGEVLITAGLVVLLFVVYEVYVTNLFSEQKQAHATEALNNQWDTDTVGPQRTVHHDYGDGDGIAKMYIPAFGADYQFTIIQGVTQDDLAIGPGHYTDSALPGQPGDFAVAGHRVGQGDPFNDLDLLSSCDAIVVETQTDWFVYRQLPMPNEIAGWATGKGASPQCSGPNGEAKVQPLGGPYAQTVGQEIVLPSEGDVVAPVPHHPGITLSAGQEASLMTMTTCNPKFSSTQRLIVHAVLVKDWKKDPSKPGQAPPEMKETS